MPTTQDLKQQFRSNRTQAIELFLKDGRLEALTRSLTQSCDQVLILLWNQSTWPKNCSLIASGGYGRSELFPGSDVDILIAVPHDSDPSLPELVTNFVSNCWDIGIEIGHAVRTVDECITEATNDVTVQTSLLESRFLAGTRRVFTVLNERLKEARDPQQFFHAKRLEMRQRHAKFEDTPYSLEPNVKESPGGLRDLQVLLWIARAAGMNHGKKSRWSDLSVEQILSPAEVRKLTSLERFMKLTRARLHCLAKRREDRLVFDLQAPLARSFGIEHPSDRRASEIFMQRYYRTAKQITQANTLLMLVLEERLFPALTGKPEPLDKEFNVRRGLLDIKDPDLFERDPPAMLRAFIRMAQNSSLQGMTVQCLQALWRARSKIDAPFRADPSNRALFMSFIRQPRGITHELRRMNQWSILGRYLPAFRRIVGRMQHDLFHVYTVDQHILMVVRNLRRFAIDEHAHEYPLCSELMGHFDKPWLLYLAALFHDIAKGRGGDHSQLGMVDAKRFAQQHKLTAAEASDLVFLVEHHLTMSVVAQKQDLSDPETIQKFVGLVGSSYRLNALYMLTVADIRGTSPKVWNNWKGKLLEDLYRKSQRYLTGDTMTRSGQVDLHQQDAQKKLALYGLVPAQYEAFWKQLDGTYFARNDPQDIAWQTRVLYRNPSPTTPIVKCRLSNHGEGFQVVVYAPDQPELFAHICAYFDSQNFSVLDARIYTTLDRYALDSFVVTSADFANRYRDILQMVEHDLALALASPKPLGSPVKGRASRRSRYFPVTPKVDLRPDERSQRFLLSISASDRTGLLFSIAKVMAKHEVNLQMARISTLGERVEDTFLIEGPRLSNQRLQLSFEEDLLEALNA